MNNPLDFWWGHPRPSRFQRLRFASLLLPSFHCAPVFHTLGVGVTLAPESSLVFLLHQIDLFCCTWDLRCHFKWNTPKISLDKNLLTAEKCLVLLQRYILCYMYQRYLQLRASFGVTLACTRLIFGGSKAGGVSITSCRQVGCAPNITPLHCSRWSLSQLKFFLDYWRAKI